VRPHLQDSDLKYRIGAGASKKQGHLALMPLRVAFESFLLEKLHKEAGVYPGNTVLATSSTAL